MNLVFVAKTSGKRMKETAKSWIWFKVLTVSKKMLSYLLKAAQQ